MQNFVSEKPFFTVRGNLLPRRELFKKLRKIWMQKTGATNKEIAALIGVTPQMASTYASGTDNRTPPWSAILTLCDKLKYEILITPSEVKLQKSI